MKTPFKVGDRVRVHGNSQTGAIEEVPYDGWKARVVRVFNQFAIQVEPLNLKTDETSFTVFIKQCRRLIKKPRRRVWLNENALRPDRNNEGGWSVCFEKPKVYLSDWVEFIEARKPKGEK